MKQKYLIVVHERRKLIDTIYNRYAETLEDVEDIIKNELTKYEEVLHIWKVEKVELNNK